MSAAHYPVIDVRIREFHGRIRRLADDRILQSRDTSPHFPEETTIRRPQFAQPVQSNLPRMNDGIRITPVRVVDQDGEMLGEMETHKARELALDAGLDLVEVSPGVRPPVCRIMDFGKSQYEKQKKLKSGAKQHSVQVKQIRLRAKTGQHDVETKVRKAREFLSKHDKVKVNVLFRGRENAHHDRGRELLQQFIDLLEGEIVVEQPPRMESGRAMSTILAPIS